MDWRVFLFFLAICLATGILFGLAPALQGSGIDVNHALQLGGRSGAFGRRTRRFTRAMVMVQLSLTVVLLFGAALMIRSFLMLYTLDLGVTTESVLTARLGLAERKYPEAHDRFAFHEQLAERLAGTPGVAEAAVATRLPLGGAEPRELVLDPPEEQAPEVSVLIVSPGYFETLNARVLRGRDFEPTDGAPGSEAVIVNQRFVSLHFPGDEPLGRRIRLRQRGREVGPWLTVVGVAPSIRQRDIQAVEPDAVVYLPYKQEPVPFVVILARGPLRAGALGEAIRATVIAFDPDLPVYSVQTLDEAMAERRWPFRVFGSLFAVFAIIALVLAGVGIYGVMAYTVSQRRQEIGVRVMLGASGRDIETLVVKQSLLELTIGMALGLAAALAAGRVLASLLVMITPSDPLALGSVTALVLGVSIAACLGPARRAARMSAVTALRES